MDVREIKVEGRNWWIGDLDEFARRVDAGVTETTNEYYDIPESMLPPSESFKYYPAIVVGFDNNEIVVGYVGYSVDEEGNGHYYVPKTGKPNELIVAMDNKYRKIFIKPVLDDRGNVTNIDVIGKAYGIVIFDENNNPVNIAFNIVCGGLCIAAAVAILGISTAASVKFWSDAKIAEANVERFKVETMYKAQREYWDRVQKFCEQNPDRCMQYFGAVNAGMMNAVSTKASAEEGGNGITEIAKTVLKILAPPLTAILSMIMLLNLVKSIFRR